MTLVRRALSFRLMTRLVPMVISAIVLAVSLAPAAAASEGDIRYGDSGARVARLQRALRSTSYPTGAVDGEFGYKTLQSVYAFEKVHGMRRDGVVTDWQLRRIERSPRPTAPDRPTDTFIDVDISRQVLFEVKDGRVTHTIPVSTGNEEYYTQDGETAKAHTPRGSFAIERKISGWRYSSLGGLYYPSYFHNGYAFHGSESVPTYPASHGCVRIPMYIAKALFNRSPIGEAVYIHE
ncbi:MAG: L,D-transpeptidase family protein [Actinomycetota bacterium]|nr:L,D-transpeptidase family protein [Actinomycetota bacterium]